MWKERTLCATPWLSLREIDGEKFKYVYSHEDRCGGNIVSVLPFKRRPFGADLLKVYTVRSEVTPCWGPDPAISAITGGVEAGQTPAQTALHELEEEAGYLCAEEDLIPLGTCRGTKSSDTVYHLFAVDVTYKMANDEPKGDGSYLETLAGCIEITDPAVAVDPMVALMAMRLQSEESK